MSRDSENNPVIRISNMDDVPKIAEVHVATWRAAYEGLLPEEILRTLSVEQRKRYWQSVVAANASGVRVAEEDGQVVGFSSFGASRDPDATLATGEIYAIYLLASKWGRGIGKALMEASLRALAEWGYTSTMLWVLNSNQRTIDFYTGMGFSQDGATKEEQWGAFAISEIRMVHAKENDTPA